MFSSHCKSKNPPLPNQIAISLVMTALVCTSFLVVQGQIIEPPPRVHLADHLRVYVSVMDPTMVKDVFGKRVAQQFVAIQVTISNKNANYQFLIHDVSLDLREVFGKAYVRRLREIDRQECELQCAEQTRLCMERNRATGEKEDCRCAYSCLEESSDVERFELSSLELSLIRGVAERGQGEDKRNKILRYFRAAGTIAAGLIGVASFGPGYAKSVAVFNGPVINSMSELYPDYTINQMNRLSDSAYKANTLVPKQQSKVIVAFIPQAEFLTKQQRKDFWNDPTLLYPKYGGFGSAPVAASNEAPYVDFRRTKALVDGSFITEVKNLAPTVMGAHIDADQAIKFLNPQPEVKGYIVGRFLEGAEVDLVNPPKGMSITLDGKPEENKLYFVIKSDKPVPSSETLNFHVFNAQGSQNISQGASYTTPVPTLDPLSPQEATQGTDSLPVTLTGSNFIEGVTDVITPPESSGVHVIDGPKLESGAIKLTLKIDADAAEGVLTFRVANGTVKSNTAKFRVNKKKATTP